MTDKTIETDDNRITIEQAIDLLINRKKHNDRLTLYSKNGLRFLHIRYCEYPKTQGERMELMFKRSSELKPYYPKIRSWFSNNNLEWRDVTVDKERYMSAILPIRKFLICDYITSAETYIFGFEHVGIHAEDTWLSLALMGNKYLYFSLIATLTASISFIGFIIYQITNIFNLTSPSFKAADKAEIILVILIITSIVIINISKSKLKGLHKKNSVTKLSSQAKWKGRFIRFALMSMLLTMFFTY